MARLALILAGGLLLAASSTPSTANDAELREQVKLAIDRAQQYLISQQLPGGSWTNHATGGRPGADALILLALVNSGLEADHPVVRKGLAHLRKVDEVAETYDAAVMIMALAAVNDGKRDAGLIARLAKRLEDSQLRAGHPGAWWYGRGGGSGSWDNSNTQFALLGLREAAHATGYPVDRATWRRARDHWLRVQIGNRESVGGAGWKYKEGGGQGTTGSMTVAGISSLTIVQSFLRDEPPDGQLDCCGDAGEDEVQQAIDAGVRWLGSHFQIRDNPGAPGYFPLYYMYGLERAGRLSGRRFFGDHDWYREGAQFLVSTQTPRNGTWRSGSPFEQHPLYGTAFGLLFISKGLAPVLINKLKFGPRDPASGEPLSGDWNRHVNDVRNLVDYISGRDKWPHLLTWQVVDLDKAAADHDVQALLQAPVQLISGRDNPRSIDGPQLELLREYIQQGGFLLAIQNCESADFDVGFRDLIKRMFPTGEFRLRRLPDTHDVYRSEDILENPPELWGVDLGCRTAIIYAPFDHACRWNHWVKIKPRDRDQGLHSAVMKSMKIGTAIIAYATNREVHDKLDGPEALVQTEDSREGRGSLRIARLRHSGGWDTARNALRHLYDALDKKVGLRPAERTVNLPLTDPALFEYPLLYMHGRQTFSYSPAEREQLRAHLENGGLLFADACCGAEAFDRSFRELIDQLFGRPMERIPIDHELFQSDWGHDIRRVERRLPASAPGATVLDTELSAGEPILEGIEIDGRLVVIYSKYDISCALERQATAACAGYTTQDATRIATNIVLYSFLQQLETAGVDR